MPRLPTPENGTKQARGSGKISRTRERNQVPVTPKVENVSPMKASIPRNAQAREKKS